MKRVKRVDCLLELRPAVSKGDEPVEVTLVNPGLLNPVHEPAGGRRVSHALEVIRGALKRHLLTIANFPVFGGVREMQHHTVHKSAGPRLARHRRQRLLKRVLGSKQVDLSSLLPVHLGDGLLTDVGWRQGPLPLCRQQVGRCRRQPGVKQDPSSSLSVILQTHEVILSALSDLPRLGKDYYRKVAAALGRHSPHQKQISQYSI